MSSFDPARRRNTCGCLLSSALDPSRISCPHLTLLKRLAGNLLFFTVGALVAVVFASLCLTPVASYAAQKKGAAGLPSRHPSISGAPASASEVVASIDRAKPVAPPAQDSADPPPLAPPAPRDVRMVRLPGHVLSALQKATLLAPSNRNEAQPIIITIVLRRSERAGFQRYLRDVYAPQSPYFHQFLTPVQVSDRFGPAQQSYDTVLAYLKTNGFKLVEGSANRMTLTVRGPRALAERTFGVHINNYRIGRTTFYANDRDPALPARIAPAVQAVLGLSDVAQPHPAFPEVILALILGILLGLLLTVGITAIIVFIISAFKAANGGGDPGSGGGFISKGAAAPQRPVYGLDSNAATACTWKGLDGAGQTIGLVEFDTFESSDVADFLSLIGRPASQISNLSTVAVNGGATAGPNQNEVLLDIDAILAISPGAKIAVYEGPFDAPGHSFQPLINKMIDDGVTIISNSWSYCEDQSTKADVTSIDALFQTAAASGISVFNAAGDSGANCLDGAAHTIGVPADSPNATAVGGTSLTPGPDFTYGSETWWNGLSETPTSGQGGFGISKFFGRPAYQNGFVAAPMRSIPDVSVNADPAHGTLICQESAGGCPTGLLNGGTSGGAPTWAAFQARINQSVGHNLGFVNPSYYGFGKTIAFHNAASMGSDFAHVGLGSPNLGNLHLLLCGQTIGPPDGGSSQVVALIPGSQVTAGINGVPADGTTTGGVLVTLEDANGNSVAGKTVTLAAKSGSATITPSSGVTSTSNGSFTFKVKDLIAENVTFSATDTTDHVALKQTATVAFVTPPASAASLDAFPASVAADGKTQAVIVVMLKDSLGRPSPNKLVQISQGPGHSVIKGPIPAVTDASGQVQFSAVDQMPETITYSATDITDGNLPFPTTGTVTFSAGPANGCGNAAPPAAPGFQVTPYATGFFAQNLFFGDVNFSGCPGAYGMAFDGSGNLYVAEFPTGNIFKFPPGGGAADKSTLITSTPLGPTLAGMVFDSKGELFASRDATTGNFNTGAIFKIDPSTGTILQTVAADLTCPTALAVDPISGDLFTDDSCTGAGSDNPTIWRISGQDTATPKTVVYTKLPGTPNANISFAPSGTIYAWAQDGPFAHVAQVSATNGPPAPTVTILPNLAVAGLGLLADGAQVNGDAQTLFLNPFDTTANTTLGIGTADLTANPPSLGVTLATTSGANNLVRGPDGCVYAAQGDGVFKITDDQGGCNYAAARQPAALVLAPPTFSPNPAQGTAQTFTASFRYTAAPVGTPIVFRVTGANPQLKMVRSDAGGQASFSYAGVFPGADTITATATLGTTNITSNRAVTTWTSGPHTTFLSLNLSPGSILRGNPVTVVGSLSDVSLTPALPVKGASIEFTLQGKSCFGTTDTKGNASCTLTPPSVGMTSLTASFAGDSTLLATHATIGFNVTGPPTFVPTSTPGPTRTPVRTPTPKPTPTGTIAPPPTHTPTPSRAVTPTPRPTPTPTPRSCVATTPVPTVPVPTPTPLPGHPVITGLTNPVLVGANFTINGRGFTKKPLVNFFVATAKGPVNEGPLTPSGITATQLVVPVPATASQGDGFVSVQVVNTDSGFLASNLGYALLQGSAAAGLPSITGLNGHGLAATSKDPNFATANVETTLPQGADVVINGSGFDVKNGVAVDVFCACPGGKLPTMFLNTGNPSLKSNSITFTLPASTPTGPGSIEVSNAGSGHSYTRQERRGIGADRRPDNRDQRHPEREHTHRRWRRVLQPDGDQLLQRAERRRGESRRAGGSRRGEDPDPSRQLDALHLHQTGRRGCGPGVRAGTQSAVRALHQLRQRPLRSIYVEVSVYSVIDVIVCAWYRTTECFRVG